MIFSPSKLLVAVLHLVSLIGLAQSHTGQGYRRVNHGLVGYGIRMSEPYCAFACHELIASNRLPCSERHDTAGTTWYSTTPECRASNDPFLLSLALCLRSHCNDTAVWDIERFWARDGVGSEEGQPDPPYSYHEALRKLNDSDISNLPLLKLSDALKTLSKVNDTQWKISRMSHEDDAYTEAQHSRYSILLLAAIISLPVFVHLIRLVSFSKPLERRLVATFGHKALYGDRHAVPLPYDAGILPTRGQALFIGYLILLNLILLMTGYRVTTANAFGRTIADKLQTKLANRAGMLAFANLFLMMLCSSRHNLAVRFTKWSYSTMLLYHRWLGYICILEALLHASIYTYRNFSVLYVRYTQAYWVWGSICLGAMIIILPLSVLPVRRRMYELFLDSHVLLSALTFGGLYLHIYFKFEHEWGYENWVYLVLVIWLLDRILRAVKVLGNGWRTSYITYIDHEYARVDIPGVKAEGHVYIYWPSLSWRVWQNHPFSIAASVHDDLPLGSVALQHSPCHSREVMVSVERRPSRRAWQDRNGKQQEEEEEDDGDATAALLTHDDPLHTALPRRESPDTPDVTARHVQHTTGLTIYLRRQRGITARLFASQRATLPVLVEGPYRPLPIPNIATAPNLICIAGGVGIATVLPLLKSHAVVGRSVLYWGSRSAALVEAVDLSSLRRSGVHVHVRVGERWDARAIVRDEARGALKLGDLIVMVSGPNQMADDVRAAVVGVNASSEGTRGRVRLVEDSFSW